MKVPWWALPGVAAIVFTLASVSATESSLNSSRVSLPREVQLSTGPHTGHHPVSGAPVTPTPSSIPGPPPDRVVAPSRPVVTQSPSSRETTATGAPGSTKGSAADPTTPGSEAPSQPSGDEGGSGASPAQDVVPVPSSMPSTAAGPGNTSTTTRPPPTTTTTTRPGWVDE